jgi:ferric-dicitrate binding protein FerR (iron transport regulator)
MSETGAAAGEPLRSEMTERLAAWSARYRRPLLCFFERRMPGGADREDLVQEVFLRLARRPDVGTVEWADSHIFEAAASVLADWRRKQIAHAADPYEPLAVGPELPALRGAALEARRPPLRRWAAAAVLVVVGGAAALTWRADVPGPGASPLFYQTGAGQRSAVTLADGSRVTLSTRSRLEVAYTPRERRVRLVAGQGRFQVARDAARPFVVTAGSRRVTAAGAAFDVRLDREALSVTMLEGSVRVQPAAASAAGGKDVRSLVAGQRLTARQGSRVDVTMVDPPAREQRTARPHLVPGNAAAGALSPA